MPASTPTEESALLGDTESISTDSQDVGPHPWMIMRIGAAMYSFAFLGLFASSIGVMLQPLIQHYSLSDLHVSLVFIVGPVGYIFAAQFSSLMHWKFGHRGVAIIAPTLHLVGVLIIATHPPFAIVLLAFAATAFGAGFLDGSLCAWAATVPNANFVTGMLQGSYSVGAAVGPFLAGTVMPAWNRPWYDWYYVLVAASALELCLLSFACRDETAAKYRGEKHDEGASLRPMFKYRATWLVALYFFAYVGIETAISGWMVTYMIRYRHMTPDLASMSSSSFWGGMAAGRFTLGVITDKLGVGSANFLYFIITIGFQVTFALVREDMLSVLTVGFMGFFMGPMFASGVVQVTRLLPTELHIAAVSFGASAGQIGAALLPFGIGAFIQRAGVSVFPFSILTLTVFTLLFWLPMLR
ncbi:hypothetical protein IFR05_001512 [Cadophora sp. M221]|nr:hypothetical protein IFR05_001512 [Cadophora sp. M221]